MIEKTIMGPMPDLVAVLLVGRDAVMPYLDDPQSDYPSNGEIAVTWSHGDVQMVSADPDELCRTGLEEALAYLAHEAVHCAYRHLSNIGETEPAEEELAYHVGAAAHGLFTDFFKWLESRG